MVYRRFRPWVSELIGVRAALWVASLSKCDNLFSRPRNRFPPRTPPASPRAASSPLHRRLSPFRPGRTHFRRPSTPRYRAPDRTDTLASLRCKWTQSVNTGWVCDPSIIFRGQVDNLSANSAQVNSAWNFIWVIFATFFPAVPFLFDFMLRGKHFV